MKTGPHTLVVGKTDSGKSTAARRLVLEHFKPSGRYREVLALDYKKDPRFRADRITDNPEEFLEWVETSRDCLLLIDESSETVGRFAGAMRRIATMYRELGHQAIFIVQRGADLDKTVRRNCSNLFCFRTGADDAAELRKDFPALDPAAAARLDQGFYIFVPSFGEPSNGNIFAGLKKGG